LRQKYKKKNLIQAAGYIVLKWLNFHLKLGNNFTCKNVCKTCWYLVGLEKFLMDLMLEAEYIDPLPDKIQEIKNEIKRRAKIFGKNGSPFFIHFIFNYFFCTGSNFQRQLDFCRRN
jgi:hypothetical protein